ncbi:hypothetical protein EAG_09758 [Camponotus floridanus]|uniref:Uncharacterized protein n=1 Tax=Camponotus floridanus TaxID=104421 RepID=E2ANP4_CAMFO|nr:hypothetical protein EAG_09758 [Camponotus floridanus]
MVEVEEEKEEEKRRERRSRTGAGSEHYTGWRVLHAFGNPARGLTPGQKRENYLIANNINLDIDRIGSRLIRHVIQQGNNSSETRRREARPGGELSIKTSRFSVGLHRGMSGSRRSLMVCLDSPSSEEGSCIFQDPARLRGRTFRHDLQKASWKVLDEDPARFTEDKLYYREGYCTRQS